MNIIIQQQKLTVGHMDIVAVAGASSVQVGDNEQVTLYSISESPPDFLQLGAFLSSDIINTAYKSKIK